MEVLTIDDYNSASPTITIEGTLSPVLAMGGETLVDKTAGRG
jgi:hypothetical protein